MELFSVKLYFKLCRVAITSLYVTSFAVPPIESIFLRKIMEPKNALTIATFYFCFIFNEVLYLMIKLE